MKTETHDRCNAGMRSRINTLEKYLEGAEKQIASLTQRCGRMVVALNKYREGDCCWYTLTDNPRPCGKCAYCVAGEALTPKDIEPTSPSIGEAK